MNPYTIADPYTAGREAFQAGRWLENNPYPPLSLLPRFEYATAEYSAWRAWHDGWLEADNAEHGEDDTP